MIRRKKVYDTLFISHRSKQSTHTARLVAHRSPAPSRNTDSAIKMRHTNREINFQKKYFYSRSYSCWNQKATRIRTRSFQIRIAVEVCIMKYTIESVWNPEFFPSVQHNRFINSWIRCVCNVNQLACISVSIWGVFCPSNAECPS